MSKYYDILIKNGIIINGSGNPWFRADIGINNGYIDRIGHFDKTTEVSQEIDAEKLIICPGFIDIHAHSDYTILIDPLSQSKIRQGVTTECVGQCGQSAAPLIDETALYLEETQPDYYRDYFDVTWRSMAEYCNTLVKNEISMNIVPFCGHGTIRQNIMGFENRPPTADELAQMNTFVRESMEQGAFGLSTGLLYTPGSYARTEEIIVLCRVVQVLGGLYASHIRNESDYCGAAVKEAIEIGRQSGVRVQISHLKTAGHENWGKAQDLLNLIESARNIDIDVTADVYPWMASSTGLDAGLPEWVHEGGIDKLLERLQNPETRDKIKHQLETGVPEQPEWENMMKVSGLENLMIVNFEPDRSLQGKRITEIAELRGKDPLDTAIDLLIEDGRLGVSIVSFDMSEQDVVQFLQHPSTCVSSDGRAISAKGPLARASCHPRYYGTFPRVLGYFVRENQNLSLQTAIRKMTSFPAQRLDLTDRGLVYEKFAADLVIFDPGRVNSRATYVQPHQYAAGIEYVLVNGELVVDNGAHTQKKPGHVLSHTPSI